MLCWTGSLVLKELVMNERKRPYMLPGALLGLVASMPIVAWMFDWQTAVGNTFLLAFGMSSYAAMLRFQEWVANDS